MAAALVDYGRSHSIEPKPETVEGFQNFPGEGIYGRIDGRDIYIGSSKISVRAHGAGENLVITFYLVVFAFSFQFLTLVFLDT